MVELQDIVDYKNKDNNREVKYSVTLKSHTGEEFYGVVEGNNDCKFLQMKLTDFLEEEKSQNDFLLLDHGKSIKVNEVVYLQIEKHHGLPF